MLNFDSDVLRAMVNLEENPNWSLIRQWMLGEATRMKDEMTHQFPSFDDVNFRERHTMYRGMAAVMDVLGHTAIEAETILKQRVEAEEQARILLQEEQALNEF